MYTRLFLLTVLLLLASMKNVAAAPATTVVNTSLVNAHLVLNFKWMWIVARIQSATLIFAASAPALTTPVPMVLPIPLSLTLNVLILRNAPKLSAVSVGVIKCVSLLMNGLLI